MEYSPPVLSFYGHARLEEGGIILGQQETLISCYFLLAMGYVNFISLHSLSP